MAEYLGPDRHTDLVPGERPLVFGYICMEEPDETQLAVWCKDIVRFCTTWRYQLGSTFIDRGAPESSFARSGFIELLAALRRPEAFAVVVPTLDQLSTDTFTQNTLVEMVQFTDSVVLVAKKTNGHHQLFTVDFDDENSS
jgi:hypothetical protein